MTSQGRIFRSGAIDRGLCYGEGLVFLRERREYFLFPSTSLSSFGLGLWVGIWTEYCFSVREGERREV